MPNLVIRYRDLLKAARQQGARGRAEGQPESMVSRDGNPSAGRTCTRNVVIGRHRGPPQVRLAYLHLAGRHSIRRCLLRMADPMCDRRLNAM
jgi:hypothetical protein